MTRLCEKCVKLDFAHILDPAAGKFRFQAGKMDRIHRLFTNFVNLDVERSRSGSTEEDGELHHASLATLRDAALQGCQLCKLFWDRCSVPFLEEQLEPPEAHDDDDLRKRKTDAQRYLEDPGKACRIVPHSPSNLHEGYCPPGGAANGISYEIGSPGASTRYFFRVEPKAGHSGPLAMRNLEDCSDIDICREWLSGCSSEHLDCPSIIESILPTRVLDLGRPGDDPQLVETHGQRGKYATLSHCWGVEKPPMTTKVNISRYMISVPYVSMPKTFRDAVDIVRELEYRYIWIDSYCIIQDDDTDRERECASMGNIYAGCAFTIAAPQASDCHAGIPRGVHPIPEEAFCDVPVRWCRGLDAGNIRISYPFASGYPPGSPCPEEFGFDTSEIGTRAWIFQERLLSPRILYFGVDRLQFECISTQCVEHVRYPLQPSQTILRRNDDLAISQLPKNAFKFGNRSKGLENWYYMVHTYSTLDLTHGSDRLPALSGISAIFAQKLGDDLIAGMWKSDIAFGLNFVVFKDDPLRSKHPSSVRGPSWSWYTWDRKVGHFLLYPDRFEVDWKGEIADLCLLNSVGAFAPLIKVTSISPTVTDKNAPGKKYRGRLTLLGRLFQVKIVGRKVYRWKKSAALGQLEPDYPLDADCTGCLSMLPLSISGNWSDKTTKARRNWHALALIAVGGSTDTFYRVGIIQSPQDFEERGVPEASKADLAKWLVSGQAREIHLI